MCSVCNVTLSIRFFLSAVDLIRRRAYKLEKKPSQTTTISEEIAWGEQKKIEQNNDFSSFYVLQLLHRSIIRLDSNKQTVGRSDVLRKKSFIELSERVDSRKKIRISHLHVCFLL